MWWGRRLGELVKCGCSLYEFSSEVWVVPERMDEGVCMCGVFEPVSKVFSEDLVNDLRLSCHLSSEGKEFLVWEYFVVFVQDRVNRFS